MIHFSIVCVCVCVCVRVCVEGGWASERVVLVPWPSEGGVCVDGERAGLQDPLCQQPGCERRWAEVLCWQMAKAPSSILLLCLRTWRTEGPLRLSLGNVLNCAASPVTGTGCCLALTGPSL